MSAAAEELKQFSQCAVSGLSNHPEDVKTEVLESGETSLCIVITCRNDDVGLIVGKQGRNIQAIRTLLYSMATKHRMKATLILKQ